MKKIFVIFLSFTFLIFTSCSNLQSNPKSNMTLKSIPSAFEGTCIVEYNDTKFHLHITRPNQNICQFAITEPKQFQGIRIDYQNGNLIFSYDFIKKALNLNNIPQSSFIPIFLHTLDFIALNQINKISSLEHNYITYHINSDYGSIIISLDKNSGIISSINIPEQNMKISFQSFHIL